MTAATFEIRNPIFDFSYLVPRTSNFVLYPYLCHPKLIFYGKYSRYKQRNDYQARWQSLFRGRIW
jgi:hypothetical protein